jgi:hypothetical protein
MNERHFPATLELDVKRDNVWKTVAYHRINTANNMRKTISNWKKRYDLENKTYRIYLVVMPKTK